MIIAVASGKGGTGKTTISVNLAKVLGNGVRLLDCDVEAPNAQLFLNGSLRDVQTVTVPVPEVDESKCDACGECSRFCRYNAIVSFGTKPLVFGDLCHGCGGCTLVCPQNAIHEIGRPIGVVETFDAGDVTVVQGRLNVGVSSSPPLIRAVRAHAGNGSDLILDAPPGTSCPVITALRGTDFVVLVTEPTPFGLNDLELAVAMVRELGIPFGVVINRYGIGDDRVRHFCVREEIPVLLEIPDDRRIAEAYSRGELIADAVPGYRDAMRALLEQTIGLLKGVGGG